MEKPFDISAEKVTIKLDSLIKVTEIAMGRSCVEVERKLSEIQNLHMRNSANCCHWVAKELARAACDYEKASSIYYALLQSKNRETLDITR